MEMIVKNRLSIRLWTLLESENINSIDYQIADIILHNIGKITDTSCKGLAKFCNVSKPSISRFCNTLGYDDFYEFRAELNQFQVNKDKGVKYYFDGNDENNLFSLYLDTVNKNIEKINNPLINQQILKLTQQIHDYPNVLLTGQQQSACTARNLEYNLYRLKKNIHAVVGYEQRLNLFNRKNGKTIYVVFSSSGDYFHTLFLDGKFTREDNDSKIWLITANPYVNTVDGVDEIINTKTGVDLTAGNISLDIVANIIAMYYWHKYQNK